MEQADFAGWFKHSGGDGKEHGSATAPHVDVSRQATTQGELAARHQKTAAGHHAERGVQMNAGTAQAGWFGAAVFTGNGFSPDERHAAKSAQQSSALAAAFDEAVRSSVSSAVDVEIAVTTPAAITSANPVKAAVSSPVGGAAVASSAQSPESSREAEPPLASTRSASAAQAPNPKVRVHAQWTDAGVRVWLGIDRDASAALPQIQRQLERVLAESGNQLLGLVCNGRPVAGATARGWMKNTQLAQLQDSARQQGLQDGGGSSGQPMFQCDEQVQR
ncbi:hypothetical protein [Ralstonia sp. 1138]|uniref:hypothetical protein n=1 Tax=Ralstonia sp. 1138 TaxID=3156423 RepID=UPI0033921D16